MKNRFLVGMLIISFIMSIFASIKVTYAIGDTDMIVSAGWSDTFVIKKDGTLWGWGKNSYGEVGNGTKDPVLTPYKIMDNVSSVSCFEQHTVAVKKDGTLWGWGNKEYGRLGADIEGSFLTPVKLMDDVKMASAGRHSTAVVKKDNTLWVAGIELGDGALGDPKAGFRKAMDKVKFVATGEDVIFAIKEDDTLWAWGYNTMGVIGNGTVTGDNDLNGGGKNVLTAIKVLDDVSYVASSGYATLAIRKDKSLWMWGGKGSNFYTMNGILSERPVSPVKIMENVQQAAMSLKGDKFVVIKPDASAWAWGPYMDIWGLKGSKDEPYKVMDNVSLISLGSEHAAVVKNDNTLWMSGNNFYAPLGFGENTGTKPLNQLLDNVMDSPDSWAVQEVKEAIYRKLVPPDMQSDYRKTVTRSDFCTLAMILIEEANKMTVEEYMIKKGIAVSSPSFADIAGLDDRARRDIIAAYNLGIVNGTSATTFEPGNPITREQAAKMLTATAAALEQSTVATSPTFEDQGDIAEWAKPYIGYVFNVKVMSGIGDNKFGPKGGYQRQQAYMTMLRLYNVITLK